MKLSRALAFGLLLAPVVAGCATEGPYYHTSRYERERVEARRVLNERLSHCLTEECRARARQDYDLRMAQIERYRM